MLELCMVNHPHQPEAEIALWDKDVSFHIGQRVGFLMAEHVGAPLIAYKGEITSTLSITKYDEGSELFHHFVEVDDHPELSDYFPDVCLYPLSQEN